MSNQTASVSDTQCAIDTALRGSGYSCKVVSWDDVNRGTSGGALSSIGSNITDSRLNAKDGTPLYTVRSDNWNEKVGVIDAKHFAILVGNCDGGCLGLRNTTLFDFLRHPHANGAAYSGLDSNINLAAYADYKVSIRFQTAFLPVTTDGNTGRRSMQFAPEAYNYATKSDEDPRNLVLLATTQGLSVQADGVRSKRLFLHKKDQHTSKSSIGEYWLEAESSRHSVGGEQNESFQERADAITRGKATSEVIGIKAMGRRFNVLATIQIPLVQKPKQTVFDPFGQSFPTFGSSSPAMTFGNPPINCGTFFGATSGFGSGGVTFGSVPSAGTTFGSTPSGGAALGSASSGGVTFGTAPSGGGLFSSAQAYGSTFGSTPSGGAGFGSQPSGGTAFGSSGSAPGGAFGSAPSLFGASFGNSTPGVGFSATAFPTPFPSRSQQSLFSNPPPTGQASATRVSHGDYHGPYSGLSITAPKRNPAEHITITCVLYNTVVGGVPSPTDCISAILDMNKLYAACTGTGNLADAEFNFMKNPLTFADTTDVQHRVRTQSPVPTNASSVGIVRSKLAELQTVAPSQLQKYDILKLKLITVGVLKNHDIKSLIVSHFDKLYYEVAKFPYSDYRQVKLQLAELALMIDGAFST